MPGWARVTTGGRGRDRGSVLMLVPAAVLVLLILGGVAVDSAVVFMAERDLANRTAAAANDVAAAAISDTGFYRGGGQIVLDADRAVAYVDLAFSPANMPAGYQDWSAGVTTSGQQVVVEASAEVRHVFAPAIPGVRRSTTVVARSTATAVGG